MIAVAAISGVVCLISAATWIAAWAARQKLMRENRSTNIGDYRLPAVLDARAQRALEKRALYPPEVRGKIRSCEQVMRVAGFIALGSGAIAIVALFLMLPDESDISSPGPMTP